MVLEPDIVRPFLGMLVSIFLVRILVLFVHDIEVQKMATLFNERTRLPYRGWNILVGEKKPHYVVETLHRVQFEVIRKGYILQRRQQVYSNVLSGGRS